MKKSSWSLRERFAAWLESFQRSAARRRQAPRLETFEERLVPAPVPVQTYYVPISETDLRTTFVDLYATTGNTIHTIVSIANSSKNTVIVYDHWEDGYEADITNPVQSTTQVWGDGNLANGVAPGFATDIIPVGGSINLENDVLLPRNPATILYDGRDFIASSKAIAVTRAAWATNPGTVMGSAVDAYDTTKYGTNFRVPVGSTTANSFQMFEQTDLIVSASVNGTTVQIDTDGNGSNDVTVNLSRGQTYRQEGVAQGATATSNQPIQAQIVTGDVGAQWESRSFSLAPTSQWSSSYYSPVTTNAAGAPLAIFLHNPDTANAITVNFVSQTGSGTISVPAGGTSRYSVPAGSGGTRLFTSGGQPFYAIGTIDSDSSSGGSNDYDWGFRLVPDSLLTTSFVVGWGPGSSDLSVNGSPVWVTAAAATRVYVDFDGNPATGVQLEPNGSGKRYDQHYDVSALQTLILYDTVNNDRNQTGTKVYTLDGTKIAGAWGQDPATAGTGSPYLDLGTTVPPLPEPYATKTANLFQDTDGNGIVSPGDLIQYTITTYNVGVVNLGNVVVIDIIPSGTSYVPGSVQVNSTPVADQGGPATPFPLDDLNNGTDEGLNVGTIVVGNSAAVTFVVQINNPYNGPSTGLNNAARVEYDDVTLNVVVTTPVPFTPGQVVFSTTTGTMTEAPSYPEDATAFITVTDSDPNQDPLVAESFTVTVTNPSTGDSQVLTLVETGVNTGVFTAPLPTSASSGGAVNDGTILALAGQTLTVDYIDPRFAIDTDSDTVVITGRPAFRIDDVTRNEAAGTMTFTVTLTGTNTATSTVNFVTANNTALAGSDFTTTSGTLSFVPGAGTRTQTITVPITNDSTYEGSETYFVNLSGAVNAAIDDNQGVGTIFDDGTGGGGTDDDRPTYTVDDVTRNEAAGTIVFTVTLTGDTNLPSSVNYATASGTATSGVDFTPTSGTLNFPAGSGVRTLTVSVPIANDGVYEGSESFFLDLSSATNATISDPQGVGTIFDDGTGGGGTDDDRPSYSVDDVTVNEDAGTMTFTVTLGGDTNLPSSVNYGTADGTATSGADFTSTSGTVNFPAGTGVRTQTVTVPITDDSVYEKSENFFLNLSGPTNATISDPQGVGTILDDGTNIGGFADDDRPTYTVDDVTRNEAAGTMTFTVTLTGDTNLPSTVDFATSSGTATSGADFTGTSGTLNFPAGSGARTQTVTVPITNDGTYEGSESFFLNLTTPTNATISDPQGVGTIFDDGTGGGGTDDDRPSYSVDDVTVNEDAGTMTFTVTLGGDTNLPSSVNYGTADGTATSGADFTSTSGTVNFPAGTGVRTQTVTVPITDDSVYEKSENFFLNLSGPTNATISDPQGVGTILDDGTNIGGFTDDDRPTYSVNDVTRNESDGTMTFTVTLTGNTAIPSSVQYGTATGSAGAGDFTGATGTLNFPPGSGARTQTVTVPITNDNVPEATEQFFLNLFNPTEATISDAQGAGTILDDDASVSATKSAALFTDADGSGDVSPGDTLRYTVVITNTSVVAATGVQLTDLLPDVDLALVVGSVTTTQGSVTTGNWLGNTTVVVNVGTLAAGASSTVQFRARIADPLTGGDMQVANQAAVTGSNLVTTPTDDPGTAAPGDPTMVPVNVPARLSGTVYRDDGDGVLGAGDTGIVGVTLTLTGTTATGVPISRTAVTDSNGFYTFLVPASNAGGYTITESEPALYQDRAVNVGTLNGSGSMVGGNDFVSGIVSPAGATGTGYNFAETNLPPSVNVGGDQSATFCGVYNFQRAGSFIDAAQDGPWSVTADYGDGSGAQAVAVGANNTFQLKHSYTREGLYDVTVTVRDSFGQSTVSQLLVGANRPLPQAYGQLVTINDGNAQRSMVSSLTVTFDQVMVIDPGAFQVLNAAGTASYTVRTVTRVINGRTVVVLEFTGNLLGGSLADGNYRILIDGSKVHTLSNAVWNGGGMYSESFYRFFGDSDGDRDVDNVDLAAMRAAQRSTRGTSAYRAYFDCDSDCDVDATDYNQFLARYRRTLAR